jgi:hypothetical protein
MEEAIATTIRDHWLGAHRLFTTEDFRALTLDWFRKVYRDVETETRFACSPSFIKGFMTRNGFSIRRQHFKRRPAASPEDIARFSAELTTLLQNESNEFILNCDETAWRLYPNGILTWWDTGVDGVATWILGDEKDAMTVLATISASHTKWPLFFVAKGKTQRVENSQIGDVGDNWRSHSESGCMNGDIFCDYLRHLREQTSIENRLFLICDVHASHRTPAVKALAEELNIQLIYIPAGATDELQPLDLKVFGSLKSEARRLFRQLAADNPDLKLNRQNGSEMMFAAWEALNEDTLEAAWALYRDEEEWDINGA